MLQIEAYFSDAADGNKYNRGLGIHYLIMDIRLTYTWGKMRHYLTKSGCGMRLVHAFDTVRLDIGNIVVSMQ